MEYKIGELARDVNVSIQTIRYYERKKLLEPISRTESGYRLYDEDSKNRLEFIKHAKRLGFTLKEIAELLKLKFSTTAKCDDVKKKTEEKIREIDERIEGLTSMRKILKEVTDSCRKGQSTKNCPILKTINNKGGEQNVSKKKS